MNYMKITKFDTANGPGIRTVLWVAGCNHRCKGCHNPHTWNPVAGTKFTSSTIDEILESLDNEHIAGLTISGGDPLYPNNISEIHSLLNIVRLIYPDKSIWLYTGDRYEDLIAKKDDLEITSILHNIDVLVDGEFIQELRDISLVYCGSSNQRVIDIKKSLKSKKVILYEEDN